MYIIQIVIFLVTHNNKLTKGNGSFMSSNKIYVGTNNKFGIDFGYLTQRQLNRLSVLFHYESYALHVQDTMFELCGYKQENMPILNSLEQEKALNYCTTHENEVYTTKEQKQELFKGLGLVDGNDRLVTVVQEINWKLEYHEVPYRVVKQKGALILSKI